jgi:hypothetical protein
MEKKDSDIFWVVLMFEILRDSKEEKRDWRPIGGDQ